MAQKAPRKYKQQKTGDSVTCKTSHFSRNFWRALFEIIFAQSGDNHSTLWCPSLAKAAQPLSLKDKT